MNCLKCLQSLCSLLEWSEQVCQVFEQKKEEGRQQETEKERRRERERERQRKRERVAPCTSGKPLDRPSDPSGWSQEEAQVRARVSRMVARQKFTMFCRSLQGNVWQQS